MQYIIFGVARSGVRDAPRGFDKRQLCVRPGHTVLTITVFAIQADEFPMPISWTTVESRANSGGPAFAHRSFECYATDCVLIYDKLFAQSGENESRMGRECVSAFFTILYYTMDFD